MVKTMKPQLLAAQEIMKKTSKHKIKLLTIVRKSKTLKSQRKKDIMWMNKDKEQITFLFEICKLEYRRATEYTLKH